MTSNLDLQLLLLAYYTPLSSCLNFLDYLNLRYLRSYLIQKREFLSCPKFVFNNFFDFTSAKKTFLLRTQYQRTNVNLTNKIGMNDIICHLFLNKNKIQKHVNKFDQKMGC